MSASSLPRQAKLWEILLICERLFRVYCRYSGAENGELRELLDELWTVDLAEEEYAQSDVSGIQSFLSSLYPNGGSGGIYIASGFIVALIDVYDFLLDSSEAYVESIKLQSIDSIRHYLEYALFEDQDAPRELSGNERSSIEASVLIKREIEAQANACAELQEERKLDSIKQRLIYDPLLLSLQLGPLGGTQEI